MVSREQYYIMLKTVMENIYQNKEIKYIIFKIVLSFIVVIIYQLF